jgi:hypothetical protein
MIRGKQTIGLRRLRLALLGGAGFLLVAAQSADAGTYKLYTCNVPGRDTPTPSTAPWTATLDGLNTTFFDKCATGGSFGIGLNQGQRFMHPGTSAGLTLMRPGTGPKAAIGIVRYRTWITAELAGSGAPAFISDGGAFAPPGGSGMWTSPVFEQSNRAVYVQLYCSTGAASDCQFDSAVPLRVDGVEADLYEDVVPTGTIDGGSLLDPRVHSGQATLDFTAIDQESGVARVEALLGETVVATADLTRNSRLCPHTDLNACVQRYTDHLAIDTARVASGDYAIALRITDAAGNQRLIAGPHSVSVANRAASDNAATGVRLKAFFANSRSTHTTNFRRSVRVRGRLLDPTSRGIDGARLEIVEQPDAAAAKETLSYTTTSSDGTFSFVASGKKPSRTIVVRYFNEVGAKAPSASRRLRLRVRAASTFKLTLRGISVRYSGRLLTRPVPRGGKQIYIQGRASGGAWQRFAVRWTDRKGRFSGLYRLRVRRPGVRLQFRVEIPKQKRYPYAPRVGRVVTRTVR